MPPNKSCRHQHNRMSFALEPPDLKNTIKNTFSPSFDSFLIVYDIQDNRVNQKSEKLS